LSDGTAALAFFGEAGTAANCALLSDGGVCFCFSSASSDWMRRSIRSSFFIKASSPSAAQALLQLKIDIAVAASSVLRQQRSD
jgi:hypothetical protein